MTGGKAANSGTTGPATKLGYLCRCCVSDGVPRRSFLVAVIVGMILNLINQGDALLRTGHLNVTKLILTFAVPYCVATYGAVSYRLSSADRSSNDASSGAGAHS
jgi:hypothetical protein